MKMKQKNMEETQCPYVLFKINGALYSINSRYISTIMVLPPFEFVPQAPEHVTGLFMHRDEPVHMFDLRSAFGIPSLEQAYQEFAQMLEARKQDHIHWVQELERCAYAGEKFALATDPHQCAFGKWYDNYHPESQTMEYELNKIDAPHKKLHHAALEVENCSKDCENCTREVCLQKILDRAKTEDVSRIVNLLDSAKELFHTSVYQEMVLVIGDNAGLGIVVDEVLSVEMLTPVEDHGNFNCMDKGRLIRGILKSDKWQDMILDVDVSAILDRLNKPAC